jgi:hypothetical protein
VVTRFASDEELSYQRDALRLEPGQALRLDPAYCQNQLPLVDPDHPDVAGPGRYAEARVSLVVVVPLAEFVASPSYRTLDTRLRRSRLAGKLAWDLLERRGERLHATVCSRLNARLTPEEIRRLLDRLRGLPGFRVRVRGPWLSGRFNRGRLYLPVYPEVDGGLDALRRIQREAGWAETGFYGIGFHNLTDHLAEPETAELLEIVAEYREVVLLEHAVHRLSLIATHDDLLLDGRVIRDLPLAHPP